MIITNLKKINIKEKFLNTKESSKKYLNKIFLPKSNKNIMQKTHAAYKKIMKNM